MNKEELQKSNSEELGKWNDEMVLKYHREGTLFESKNSILQKLEKRILKDMKDYLGITAKIKLVGPNSLPRFEGKASRVIDKRRI